MARTIFRIELSEEEKEVLKKATSILGDIRDTFPEGCDGSAWGTYLLKKEGVDNLIDICTSYPFND